MSKRKQQQMVPSKRPVEDADCNACTAWEDLRSDDASSALASQQSTPASQRSKSRQSRQSLASQDAEDSFFGSLSMASADEEEEDADFLEYSQSCHRWAKSFRAPQKPKPSEESPTPFQFAGQDIFSFLKRDGGVHLYNTSQDDVLPAVFRAPQTTRFLNTLSAPKAKQQRGSASKEPVTVTVFGGTNFQGGMTGLQSAAVLVATENMPGFVNAMASDIAEQHYPHISFCAKGIYYRARLVFDFDLKIHHVPSFPDAFFLVLSVYITQIVSEMMSSYEGETVMEQHDVIRKVSSITAIRKSVNEEGVYQKPTDGKVGMHLAFDVFCSIADCVILRRRILQRLQEDFGLGDGLELYLLDQTMAAAAAKHQVLNTPPMWKYVTKHHTLTEDDVLLFTSRTKECMLEMFTRNQDLALRDANNEFVKVPLDSFFDVLPITGRMLRPPWTFKVDKKKQELVLLKNMYVPMLAVKVKKNVVQETALLRPYRPTEVYAQAMIPLLVPNITYQADVLQRDVQPIFLRHPARYERAKRNEDKVICAALDVESRQYGDLIHAQTHELPPAKIASRDCHLGEHEQTQVNEFNILRLEAARDRAHANNTSLNTDVSANMIQFLRSELGDACAVETPIIALGQALANLSSDQATVRIHPAQFPFRSLLYMLMKIKDDYPYGKGAIKYYAGNPIEFISFNSKMTKMSIGMTDKVYCPVKGNVHNKEGGDLIFFFRPNKKQWHVMFQCRCKHKGQPIKQPECNPEWTGCGDHNWNDDMRKAPVIAGQVAAALSLAIEQAQLFKGYMLRVKNGEGIEKVALDIANMFSKQAAADVFGDKQNAEGMYIGSECTMLQYEYL